MSNSVRPHRQEPTRLHHPWDSPGKNTGAGCHFLLQCMKVKSESEVAQSCPTLSDLMDCSLPGFMGFSRQEYWSGVPLTSPTERLTEPQVFLRSLSNPNPALFGPHPGLGPAHRPRPPVHCCLGPASPLDLAPASLLPRALHPARTQVPYAPPTIPNPGTFPLSDPSSSRPLSSHLPAPCSPGPG